MATSDTLRIAPPPEPAIATRRDSRREFSAAPASGQLKWLSLLFVALFSFLLASFPARNSDLWAHLTAGRELAQAPGSLFSAGQQLLPTWLYDLACYALYTTVGGFGLVLLKALFVVGMSLIMLQLSRAAAGWWLSAVSTALAILAMSTRLAVQPATFSYCFLALALWLVWRQKRPAGRPPALLPPLPLLVLFVVWVNVDSWFVVGLGTVALVWLGAVLDETPAVGGPLLGRLYGVLRGAFALALLAAACLLNPSHIHAFVLPPELAAVASTGSSTALVAPGQIMSAFDESYFKPGGVGLTPAGLAYFPLLGFGILSFILVLPRWHWQRFLPWLALAALSALQVRAVPFFAVLAGPVLAWNLQEFFARHSESERQTGPLWQRALATLRVCTVVLALAFLLCAWPGWLQLPPFEPRRWAVDLPPSLERGAALIQRWHEEGKLGPDTGGLFLSPEAATAFAWFCPEEKGLLDDRLSLSSQDNAEVPEALTERLRSAGINHVIVYDPNRKRLLTALEKLLADPAQWPLLGVQGGLAVFGWRDPARAGGADPYKGWEVDVEQLAFNPAADKRAPREGPEEHRRWWDAFWKPALPLQSLDRDEAMLYLHLAEASRRWAPYRLYRAWVASQYGALVAAAHSSTGPGRCVEAQLRCIIAQPPIEDEGIAPRAITALANLTRARQIRYTFQQHDTPPALLYLAVRAARRATIANPDDAYAYLILGNCYLGLLHATRERVWAERMPELDQLRRIQALAALNQAVVLNPDLGQAHAALGKLYLERKCFDLALQHLRTHARLLREAGPPPGLSDEQFEEQQNQYEEKIEGLAREVQNREADWEVTAGGSRILDQAREAYKRGLWGKARDLLLETDVTAFGSPGMALEVELLLETGRPMDVREWLGDEQESVLGSTGYFWLRVQAQAALGDYAHAQDELELMAGEDPTRDPRFRDEMASFMGQTILDEQPGLPNLPFLLERAMSRLRFRSQIDSVARNMKRRADVLVLRGLLALEQGDVVSADEHFRLALVPWQNVGLDFSGRTAAEGCLEWLK
jgi:hypothetical protein